MIQAEFSQLIFPIFAHSYIALMDKHPDTARKFFNRFKIFIPECFSEFVHKLSLIEDQMTMRPNEYVRVLRENKVLVKLSKPTQKHLESIQTRLIGVKNIIAKHINIESEWVFGKKNGIFRSKTSISASKLHFPDKNSVFKPKTAYLRQKLGMGLRQKPTIFSQN